MWWHFDILVLHLHYMRLTPCNETLQSRKATVDWRFQNFYCKSSSLPELIDLWSTVAASSPKCWFCLKYYEVILVHCLPTKSLFHCYSSNIDIRLLFRYFSWILTHTNRKSFKGEVRRKSSSLPVPKVSHAEFILNYEKQYSIPFYAAAFAVHILTDLQIFHL